VGSAGGQTARAVRRLFALTAGMLPAIVIQRCINNLAGPDPFFVPWKHHDRVGPTCGCGRQSTRKPDNIGKPRGPLLGARSTSVVDRHVSTSRRHSYSRGYHSLSCQWCSLSCIVLYIAAPRSSDESNAGPQVLLPAESRHALSPACHRAVEQRLIKSCANNLSLNTTNVPCENSGRQTRQR
jgi:hypothetical protein